MTEPREGRSTPAIHPIPEPVHRYLRHAESLLHELLQDAHLLRPDGSSGGQPVLLFAPDDELLDELLHWGAALCDDEDEGDREGDIADDEAEPDAEADFPDDEASYQPLTLCMGAVA